VKEVVVNEPAPIRFYGTISRCRLMENAIRGGCELERLLKMRGLLKATQSKQGPSTYQRCCHCCYRCDNLTVINNIDLNPFMG